MLAPAPRTLSNDGVIDAAKAALGDMIVDTLDAVGEIALTIDRPRLIEAMIGLRDTPGLRSAEHTSELQSSMRISYAVFCLKKRQNNYNNHSIHTITRDTQ